MRAFARALASLAVLLCAAGGPSSAQAKSAAPIAVAFEAEIDGPKTRLTFTLSAPVAARAFGLEAPDRIVVDLPEVNFQLPHETGRRREGLISSFRFGLFAPGRSRIVIDLAQPATVSGIDAKTREKDGATLLTIELSRTDRESFRRGIAAADRAAPDGAAEVSSPAGPADPRPVVIIDPGHGGIDPGAIASTGAYEKDIVFAFARRLKQKLVETGRYRVSMTREHDVFVPLDTRVEIAQGRKADLLISIHADSISSAPHIRGFTVYTGAKRATDAESARLADRENEADETAGLSESAQESDVADILQELTGRETRGFSQRIAKRLIGDLGAVIPTSKKPHREAGFRVLRAPDVPSVLVELGYLSSRKDIDLLMSDEWRDRSSAAMAGALDRYFATRLAGGAAALSP